RAAVPRQLAEQSNPSPRRFDQCQNTSHGFVICASPLQHLCSIGAWGKTGNTTRDGNYGAERLHFSRQVTRAILLEPCSYVDRQARGGHTIAKCAQLPPHDLSRELCRSEVDFRI